MKKKFEIRKVSLFLHVIESGAKIIQTSYSPRPPPPLPPQRQCCYHDTKLQCWLKTFTQHCQWGEGGK